MFVSRVNNSRWGTVQVIIVGESRNVVISPMTRLGDRRMYRHFYFTKDTAPIGDRGMYSHY
jgi:hypothetical protein